jgi:hypothetical protein
MLAVSISLRVLSLVIVIAAAVEDEHSIELIGAPSLGINDLIPVEVCHITSTPSYPPLSKNVALLLKDSDLTI